MSCGCDVTQHFLGERLVKLALIDTDILSLFFRGHSRVVSHFQSYTSVYPKVNFSIITYYEILSGLKHRDARKQLATFLEFVTENNLILLTEHAVDCAAEIYAVTRAQGRPIDDIDILIAGVAMANQWSLVTHNRQHFEQIDGLEIVDWSE